MDAKTKNLLEEAEQARARFRTGQIGHDEAYAIAQRYIDRVNEKGIEIAKRFGVRPRPVSVRSFMR